MGRNKLPIALAVAVGVVLGWALASPHAVEIPPALAAGSAQPQDARQAITKSSEDFVQAFNKGDAKAVALFWTENGEFHDEYGQFIVGRAALAKTYAEFFEKYAGSKIEVRIKSIRFPSSDCAVEQGILRVAKQPSELPSSTRYTAIHVREGGQWKMAVVWEWGIGQDRLEDLEWLVGDWNAKNNGREVNISFEWDRKSPFMTGRFVVKADGKTVSVGTKKIGIDPQTGQLRSWSFDDDGGHGQSLWIRDGNRWVLDSIGVLASGAETASVNILTRINENEFTWRSIDRMIGGEAVPDTIPIRLTRVKIVP